MINLSHCDNKDLYQLVYAINCCINLPNECDLANAWGLLKQFKNISSFYEIGCLFVDVADSIVLRQKYEILASADVRTLIKPNRYVVSPAFCFEFINVLNRCIYFENSYNLTTAIALKQCENEDYIISKVETQLFIDEQFSKYECAITLLGFADDLKNNLSKE